MNAASGTSRSSPERQSSKVTTSCSPLAKPQPFVGRISQ